MHWKHLWYNKINEQQAKSETERNFKENKGCVFQQNKTYGHFYIF